MSFLNEHQTGETPCTPLKPCGNCLAVALLRANLSQSVFDEFVQLLGEQLPVSAVESVELSTTLESISDYGRLAPRIRKRLAADSIHSVGDLVRLTEKQVRNRQGLGPKSYKELQVFLSRLGYQFARALP